VTPIRALAIALLLASGPPGAARADHALALGDAIRMALQKNEDLVISRESVTAAGANLRGARGVYDPVLELSGGWSQSTEPVNSLFSGAPAARFVPRFETGDAGAALHQYLPTGGALSLRALGSRQTTDGINALLTPAFSTQMGVELRQPLLRDLSLDESRLRIRVTAADRHAAIASLRRSVSETIAAVNRGYWNLVAAGQGVGVREDAVRLAEQQLEETRTRVQSGSTPGTELSQPRAELERRRGELLSERETQARAQSALKLLVLPDAEAAHWLEPLAPSDSVAVNVAPVDLAGALERSLAVRPEVDEANALLERRRAETARAHSGVLPALDAVVSYDRFGIAGTRNPASPLATIPPALEGDWSQSWRRLADGDFDATRVAVVLGLPITNRSARSALVAAQSAERQAGATLERTRKTVCAEVLDAVAALETAGQRVAAAQAGREAAEIQLAAERDRYATGLSTNFLVLTRQNDLSRARLDEISARTDFAIARTELERATGSLIADSGIDFAAPTPEGGNP
jgi:outer membrane protein TolC